MIGLVIDFCFLENTHNCVDLSLTGYWIKVLERRAQIWSTKVVEEEEALQSIKSLTD